MNEAEHSNSPNWFESNDSQTVSAQVEGVATSIAAQAQEGEWETVDLPNALSVDDLPQELAPAIAAEDALQTRVETLEQQQAAAISHIQTLEQQQAAAISHIQTLEQQRTTAVDHIQTLEHRNSELANQVSQFETALEQARKAMRLERRRWKAQIISQMAQAEERSQAQAAVTLQKEQALADTQEQATKLLQELEQSHQIGQRQQILIQTLTEQLETSQEQVAQLERECAATQQRYDEQIQFVRQAETACRDLRSRLHRQQRYTLQFKAALEKCLDVSTPAEVEVSQVAVAASSTLEADASVQFLAPKAQPVQPWSAQPAVSEIEAPDLYLQGAYSAWPTPLEPVDTVSEVSFSREPSNFADPFAIEQPIEAPAVPPILVPQPQPPAQPVPVSYTIGRSPEADEKSLEEASHWEVELFDPQFGAATIAAPEAEPLATPDRSSEPEATEVLIAENDLDPAVEIAESDLDQKLEAALQTFDAAPEAEADSPVSEFDVPVSDPANDLLWNDLEALIDESPTNEELTPATSTSDADAVPEGKPSFITPFEQVVMEHFAAKSESGQPAFAMTAPPESEAVEMATAFQSKGPSPIVYPLRSPKKLKSLAAVDLPSFPRRGN